MDYFIIIPFSKFYYIWTLAMIFACTYTLFIVPFAIALEYDYSAWLYPFDIISLLIFLADIFITSRTAFDSNFEIIVDLKSTIVEYMDSRFFLDVLAILPIDYLLIFFSTSQQVVAFCRALRLLKMYKPIDYIRIWRKHSNFKIALFTLFLMTILFVIISHLMG